MNKNDQENRYKAAGNYLLFEETGNDAVGVNFRAGEINQSQRKASKHVLLTEVYPFLHKNPNIWKRINILLEGVKKSNIPKLYSPEQIVQNEDKYYLVYPLLKAKTLEQVIEDSVKKDMPINFDQAFFIAFATADLIDVGSSIVVSGEKSFHGFLTPDNILIDYDGKIMLKNYGIYPYLNREEEVLAEMEKRYGAWMAPEFLRKEKLLSQTDIYHLGYIIYRILTGKYFVCAPNEDFDSKFSNITFTQHIPSSDKEFFSNLITFFKKTLNPLPSQRFGNIKEFKDFVSSKFHIEELSSVTFNLAYFMNSLYLELAEEETKIYAAELAYIIPETKKKEDADAAKKTEEHLVEELLTGIEKDKKSRMKIVLPLVAVIIVIVAISIYLLLRQQRQVRLQQEEQVKAAETMKLNMEKIKKELESEYKRRLKSIEEKTVTTEEEKKSQEEEIKKLKEWQVEQAKIALEKQKQEQDRVKREEQAKVEQKQLEDEQAKLKAQEEQQRLEDENKKKQEEQRKELIQSQQVKEGDLIALVEATEKPEKIKGSNPSFSTILQKKYKGMSLAVRTILLINHNGDVEDVKMLAKTPEDMESVISKTFKKWKYKPAQKGDVKVKVWLPVAIHIAF